MNHFKSSIILGLFFSLVTMDSDVLFVAVHILLTGGGGLIFDMVCKTPIGLVSKLSWDNDRPASSDFALSLRRKKAHRGKIWHIGRLVDHLFAFAAI
jgi:hypothetical protein